MSARKNIGIFAHVDAGKTSITEQLLFQSGAIRQAGSVDQGTSATDSLQIEQARGISVRLATATCHWRDEKINIIDTPGHVDFSAEVERCLSVLDGAIMVISAVEGVQAQTITIFHALQALAVPTLFVINKIDRTGADVDQVMAQIQAELQARPVLLQQVATLESQQPEYAFNWLDKTGLESSNRDCYQQMIEQLAEYDDGIMETYLEGERVTPATANAALKATVCQTQVQPVLLAAAKVGFGIKPLLDAIVDYLPKAEANCEKPLSAKVFKIEYDKQLGKMAYLRVFQGRIKSRDVLLNKTRQRQANSSQTDDAFLDKAGQLKTVVKGKYQDISSIEAGDVGVVSGLSQVQVGDIYGDDTPIKAPYSLATPLLTVQVIPEQPKQFADLAKALTELADEDPLLELDWLTQQRELHIKINGAIQLEILQSVLLERYNLQASFEKPSIIYRETPAATGFGYERYWMPKPCWAIVKFKIEPGERGSGVVYSSEVGVNDIAAKYQNEIVATLDSALKQGIKGWQVTDIKITLVEGSDHEMHSRSGDFAIATPMALLNGLTETDTQLLEPMLRFSITANTELLGTITSDITKMRGTFEPAEIDGSHFTLKGLVPAATSMDYPIELASKSGGKARFNSRFDSYQACALEHGHTVDYRGVSPLDRDKWILHKRGAL